MITSEKLQIINDYHHLSTIPEPMSQVFTWIPGSWAGLTLYYLKQTFLIINQHDHAWSMVAPAPAYQVEIISSGSRRETLNAHACVTSRHFSQSNCSMRIRLLLEEKGLSWTSHYLDLMKGENLTDE